LQAGSLIAGKLKPAQSAESGNSTCCQTINRA
jgi:hypothetical protein